jgi:hypothetical protein
MTNDQYERWKDFALRMARTCFTTSRRPPASYVIEQVESWFYWRDYQQDFGEYNSWDQDDYPLCDHISEFYDDQCPGVRCKACSHECRQVYPYYEDSCRFCDMECTCHEREQLCWEQFEDQWLGPVRSCIRAGLDLACEPSAGVVGFSAGDIRRMYPEGVPDWVKAFFVPGELVALHATQIGGIFVPENMGFDERTFDELPDSAGVWL